MRLDPSPPHDPTKCKCFFDGWSETVTHGCPLHDYLLRDAWLGRPQHRLSTAWSLFVMASFVALWVWVAITLAVR